MTGIHAQTGFACGRRSFKERRDGGFGVGGIKVGLRLGVEFHTVGACSGGCPYGVCVGIYED